MDWDFWMLSQDEMTYRMAAIPEKLLAWYDAGNRKLPWRDKPTPYRVWISEIMLQQTRVQAVLPYFERFIAALPDVQALSEVPDDQLMKLWEGLGYYSRAKNLKRAAKIIICEMDGVIPDTAEQLKLLPGIGEYTAGAIASIAYQRRTPAVDGNVLRVLARVFRNEADILNTGVKRHYRDLLTQMLPSRAGDFNQALMELGAVVCAPNGEPRCDACPLAAICIAHQDGCETALPVKAPKAKRKVEQHVLTLIICKNEILIKKRPESGVLAGLWAFYDMEHPEFFGMSVLREQELPHAKHIFTHIEWHMSARAIFVAERTQMPDGIWVTYSEIQNQYAIPTAYRAYTKLLPELLG